MTDPQPCETLVNTPSHCSVHLQHHFACQLTHSLFLAHFLCVCVFCVSIIQQHAWGRRSCRAHCAALARANSSADSRLCRFLLQLVHHTCFCLHHADLTLELVICHQSSIMQRRWNNAVITVLTWFIQNVIASLFVHAASVGNCVFVVRRVDGDAFTDVSHLLCFAAVSRLKCEG